MRRQRNEFEFILSALPQGLLIARMKPRSEIQSEIVEMEEEKGLDHLDAAEKICPFSPQFINKELEQVLDLTPDAK